MSETPTTDLSREDIERVRKNAADHSYDGTNFRTLCDMALAYLNSKAKIKEAIMLIETAWMDEEPMPCELQARNILRELLT